MAKNFKPFFHHITKETIRDYQNGQSKTRYKYVEFPTYRELLKELPKYLNESVESEITVFRHRRGEWGEWFEKWIIVGTRLLILAKGWN